MTGLTPAHAEIVAALRTPRDGGHGYKLAPSPLELKAADVITDLTAQVERLTDALRKINEHWSWPLYCRQIVRDALGISREGKRGAAAILALGPARGEVVAWQKRFLDLRTTTAAAQIKDGLDALATIAT